MTGSIKADICIIGAGSGGLSVAAGTAQLGLKTVLIERGEMGGDCLNTGCVPSKALLAASKRAQVYRKGDIKGILRHDPVVDFSAVKEHVFDTIKTIAPNDAQERFEKLGVTVLRESAIFTGRNTLQAGKNSVEARYFVIATGSRPAVPAILGLELEKYFTNENIFDLREKPEHLLIIGGGPIGIEMAQAHLRLGCTVSLFDMGTILPQADPTCADFVRQALLSEGVRLFERVKIKEIKHENSGPSVILEMDDGTATITGTHLLLATGRKPNTEGMGLEKAGVSFKKKGIEVDNRLRTKNKKVFAIGDVAGGPQFTHVAGYHAGIVIRNICFKLPAKVDYKSLPWCVYSDPEIAQAGLTERDAREKYGDKIRVAEWPFADNDRAIAERVAKGLVRVITKTNGKILGASIAGPQAGEQIGLWSLAISSDLKISHIAGMIAPYPTLGEAGKRAAGAWYAPSLFSERTRRFVRLLQKLPF